MYQVSINGKEPLSFNEDLNLIAENAADIDVIKRGENEFHALVNGKSILIEINTINAEEKTVSATVNGKPCQLKITDKMDLLLKSMGLENALVKKMNELKAPMPGLVLDVKVAVGDTVTKGDALLVLEAMKMENVIKAAGDGIVKEIKIAAKDAVDKNQVLITFE